VKYSNLQDINEGSRSSQQDRDATTLELDTNALTTPNSPLQRNLEQQRLATAGVVVERQADDESVVSNELVVLGPINHTFFKVCRDPRCTKRPCFSFRGGKAEYCVRHKLEGMVDVSHQTCKDKTCFRRPCFGRSGGKAEYCVEHKLEDMVDVAHKKCREIGCKTLPYFGFLDNGEAVYCVHHKLVGMVDVLNIKCRHPGCNVRPYFGNQADGKAVCCYNHKDGSMVDVMSPRCRYSGPEGCLSRATCGEPGKSPKHCLIHVQAGEITRPHISCVVCRLAKATCGIGLQQTHCAQCAESGMIDLVRRLCRCGRAGLFVDEDMGLGCKPTSSIILHHQEFLVLHFFARHGLEFIHDKCAAPTRFRPDLLRKYGQNQLIVEVDEHQHVSYGEWEEKKRMLAIGGTVHGRTVFIRYNPDNYKPGRFRHVLAHNERLDHLLKTVRHWERVLSQGGAQTGVSAVYMFYDGDEGKLERDEVILHELPDKGSDVDGPLTQKQRLTERQDEEELAALPENTAGVQTNVALTVEEDATAHAVMVPANPSDLHLGRDADENELDGVRAHHRSLSAVASNAAFVISADTPHNWQQQQQAQPEMQPQRSQRSAPDADQAPPAPRPLITQEEWNQEVREILELIRISQNKPPAPAEPTVRSPAAAPKYRGQWKKNKGSRR